MKPADTIPKKSYPFFVKAICALHFLLGLGAVFGGGAFIIDPSGELLGIPLDLVENSIFPNYLIPGAILFMLFGVVPIYLSFVIPKQGESGMFEPINIFKEKHWSWALSLYIGFALCIWIVIQVYIIKGMHAIHLLYFFWGVFIQVLTLHPKSQRWFDLPTPIPPDP